MALLRAFADAAKFATFSTALHRMRVVIFVDLILGPLLTMVVFQCGKKELKRDLGIIASVQLIAFVCGAGLMMQYARLLSSTRTTLSLPCDGLIPSWPKR